MLEEARTQYYQRINDRMLSMSDRKKNLIAGRKIVIFKHHNMIKWIKSSASWKVTSGDNNGIVPEIANYVSLR